MLPMLKATMPNLTISLVGAKAELEKNIWMVAAELGQEPGL